MRMFAGLSVAPSAARNLFLFVVRERVFHFRWRTKHQRARRNLRAQSNERVCPPNRWHTNPGSILGQWNSPSRNARAFVEGCFLVRTSP
jgi:hypothetical protein